MREKMEIKKTRQSEVSLRQHFDSGGGKEEMKMKMEETEMKKEKRRAKVRSR